jgi:hypothetical protein
MIEEEFTSSIILVKVAILGVKGGFVQESERYVFLNE